MRPYRGSFQWGKGGEKKKKRKRKKEKNNAINFCNVIKINRDVASTNIRECDVTQIFISLNTGLFYATRKMKRAVHPRVVIVSTRQQQEKFIVIRGRLFLRSNRNPRYHGPSRQLFRNISLVQRKRSLFFRL